MGGKGRAVYSKGIGGLRQYWVLYGFALSISVIHLSTCKHMTTVHGFHFFLSFFKDLFIYYVYNILPLCMLAGQKRAPDLFIDGCEPPCGCWEMNSGPLEEQAMLLTSEPSFQPPILVFLLL